MDRRYFVAFLVSLLILLVYPQYLKWVGVSHSEKTTYNSPEPTLAPARPGPKEPVSAPSIHFHNNQYGVDFTTLGGNITLLSYQDVELYKSTAQGAGIFGLRISSTTLFRDGSLWTREVCSATVMSENFGRN